MDEHEETKLWKVMDPSGSVVYREIWAPDRWAAFKTFVHEHTEYSDVGAYTLENPLPSVEPSR